MKKILIAHDLSCRSSIAFARALELARQTGASLDVLHVIEDDLPLAIIERRKAEATEVINADLSAALPATASRIEVHVLVGKDYTDILDRAEKSAATLIVLAAHREDALRAVVIGTTAERVIGFGTRPVLIVKNRPAGQYRRVVVAVDFSASARRAAAFAFDLLPEAEFRLLHASPLAAGRLSSDANAGKAEKIKSYLSALLFPVGADATRNHLVVRHGPALAVIRDEVTAFNADVLVVGAQRRSGLTRALIGEIPEDLLARPPCDIIAVHA